MSPSIRKLVGTVLLLVLVIGYSLVVMLLAATMLAPSNKWGELVFYAVAGLAWVVPAGLIIRWMHKVPDGPGR